MNNHNQIKFVLISIILFLAVSTLSAQTPEQLTEEKQLQQLYSGYRGVSPDYLHAGKEAIEQFQDLKYGLRIHWGIYSEWGIEASWDVRNKFDNDKREQYYGLVNKFNPTEFDPDEWMELFKELGFTFFTITTKHHDGFSLFDTKTKVKKCWDWNAQGGPKIIDCDTSFSIMDTPYKKDIIKQLTDAAHKHGLKIDLYFSHPDWFDADQRFDLWHPLKGTPICDEYNKESDPAGYWRFMKRHRQQITELLSNYGTIDMMCLDMKFPEWAQQDLIDTIKAARKIQPKVMFRRRGINEYGDYTTPERWYPKSPDDPKVTMPWLAIDPVGEIFAYQPDGARYRDDKWLLTTLIKVVSTGGNFSPAIGPDASGKFHPTVIEYLRIVGKWLKVNGEAIYKTRPWYWFSQGDSIRFTRSKDYHYVYAILMEWPGNTLALNGIKPKSGAKITLLADANKTALNWNFNNQKLLFNNLGATPSHGEHAWVLKIPVEQETLKNRTPTR
ncbi:MAG: alpha-L-fucosidase [Planctomycetota bacterium]